MQTPGRLEVEESLDADSLTTELQTPAPRSTKPTRARRRVRTEEVSSDESETSPAAVPATPTVLSTRSQRASKTAALNKMTGMTAKKDVIFEDDDEDGSNCDEVLDGTSDDESDEFTE